MPINYNDYPRNWKTEIVPAIRNRADNKCEECGIPNGIVIQRHRDGSWTEASAKDWILIETTMDQFKISQAQAMKKCKFFRIVLTTAHFDHNAKNNSWHPEDKSHISNNLFYWCQKCHLYHDRYQHAANKKYGRKWKQNQLKFNL